MNVRAEIIARGEVQRVGYRDLVERAARNLQLTGFVENVKPYDVRIVCEGERAAIDTFLEQIRITKYPIEVADLAVRFEPATGEYEYFEIKRGDMAEELGERLDLARTDMTKLIEKQDLMVRKQEETIQVLKEESEKTREVVRDESEKTRELIGSEGEKTRSTLKGTLEEDMVWVKDEIVGIKVTLNKVKEKVGVE
jgi:acylphosphatase